MKYAWLILSILAASCCTTKQATTTRQELTQLNAALTSCFDVDVIDTIKFVPQITTDNETVPPISATPQPIIVKKRTIRAKQAAQLDTEKSSSMNVDTNNVETHWPQLTPSPASSPWPLHLFYIIIAIVVCILCHRKF